MQPVEEWLNINQPETTEPHPGTVHTNPHQTKRFSVTATLGHMPTHPHDFTEGQSDSYRNSPCYRHLWHLLKLMHFKENFHKLPLLKGNSITDQSVIQTVTTPLNFNTSKGSTQKLVTPAQKNPTHKLAWCSAFEKGARVH